MSEPTPATPSKRIIIEPAAQATGYWRELWEFRELFGFLTWRDVAVRYKQTVIGVGWAFFRPMFQMVLMTFVFGTVAGLDKGGDVPYALIVLMGVLPWGIFSSAVSSASASLVANRAMIAKIYFPRLMIPFSSMGVALVDFAIGFAILGALCLWFDVLPTIRLLFIPVLLMLTFVATMAVSLWFATLSVTYRDFRFIVPLVMQAGLFLSPIGYTMGELRERSGDLVYFLYYLNPMTGIIDGFRWAIAGGEEHPVYWEGLLLSAGVSALLFWLAIKFFRRFERTFADVI